MKRFILIGLLSALVTVSGCGGGSSDSGAAGEVAARAEVSPCGWNQFSWDELNAREQELWTVMGWNENRWNNGLRDEVSSVGNFFADLPVAQQEAALELGYTEETWNNFRTICNR